MPLDVAHPSALQYPPEGLVPSYAQLRAELASRDRSLRRKVMSLEDAAAFVNDGDTVGIGGSTMSRTPMGDDLGVDPRRASRPFVRAQHHVERRRPAVRLGHLRSHHHQLVQSGHPVGRVQSDAPPRRDRRRDATTSGATWRSACAFAPAPWACPSCRSARCSARTSSGSGRKRLR